LRDRDVTRAVDKLSVMAQGIGGGTRIGESLATFNRWHARRVINSRTAMVIVSDGYDTGKPEQLAGEMRRLRRRCRKIAWLNPLIGWRDYTPQARGMQAALPYVDLFAPAHNLESLAALEPYLARLGLYEKGNGCSGHHCIAEGGRRTVRARDGGRHSGGNCSKGRRQGGDLAGRNNFRGVDRGWLRSGSGHQSGQGCACRWPIPPRLSRAARRVG